MSMTMCTLLLVFVILDSRLKNVLLPIAIGIFKLKSAAPETEPEPEGRVACWALVKCSKMLLNCVMQIALPVDM